MWQVLKCKYNIVRNGETKHLCDDECFKTFRARPTSFLQSTGARRAAAAAAKCDYCHAAVSSDQHTHTVGKVSKTFCKLVSLVGALMLCLCCQIREEYLGICFLHCFLHNYPRNLPSVL